MDQSVFFKRFKSPVYTKSLVTAFLLLFSFAQAMAQGDLLISPLRIIFEGNKKSQEINLANVGKDTATYAISIKDIRMNEDGSFEEITAPDSGQNFAGPFLRFFPRSVTLAPNEAQVIKVQVIKSSQMTNGEYRSHIYFRAVPDEKLLGEKPKSTDTGGISISLKPVFGITIPVIIRVGDNDADATISNVSFVMVNDTPRLSLAFNRTGIMSVYGDLKVDYISPSGKTTQVKIVKGIGVYTPNKVRRFSADLDNDHNIGFNKGKLHVSYTMQMSNKTQKVVEADVDLK